MILKHKIVVFFRKHHLTETRMFKILQRINFLLFHQNMKETKKNFGELNPDKIFYIIREGTKENGLLSIYMRALKRCVYALDKGYVPYFDGKTWPTQYNDCDDVNSWELFFKQPTSLSYDEIYKSKNVILSGKSVDDYNKLTKELSYSPYCDKNSISELYKICKEHLYIKDSIIQEVNDDYNALFLNNSVLGVYMRGTDYTSLKPAGHYIQPDLHTVISDVDRYLQKYQINKIFMVTEDEELFNSFYSVYGEKIIKYNDYRFSGYDGKDYLAGYKIKISKQELGMIYLKKMLLLSRCEYLIGGITNGTQFALIMNNNEYKDKIIYNLGKY